MEALTLKSFAVLRFLGLFAAAPLLLGIAQKTKAVFGGRKGAPVLQFYYDIGKLFKKGAVYSKTTSGLVKAGPVVSLAALSTAFLLLPLFNGAPLFSFDGDFILLTGLLVLARFAVVLAALDTGSSFEGMGASREVQFAVFSEAALFLTLAAQVRLSGALSLAGMADHFRGPLQGGAVSVVCFSAAALFLLFLTENARVPVDNPDTHLELTMIHEAMVLDHSGPDLGLILLGQALKFAGMGMLFLALAFPFFTGHALVDAVIGLLGLLALSVITGIVESVMARLRMRKVPRLLVAAAGFSLLALMMNL